MAITTGTVNNGVWGDEGEEPGLWIDLGRSIRALSSIWRCAGSVTIGVEHLTKT